MEDKDDGVYRAWRRSEAYMVPISKEGMEMAEKRYHEFKKGFYAGVNASMLTLEEEHSKNKHIHRFYLLAKDLISKLKEG